MPTIVGVKLRYAGKVLWFDPAGSDPEPGDHVIVSTERGQEYGEIVTPAREVTDDELQAPLKPVLRVADESDRARFQTMCERERIEMERFRALVKERGLDMKPIGVEHLFDDSKIVFYFAAEERIDFRDLVRDLAAEFHNRIDMRQVGVRDEARMIGGLGHCGQQLCCVRFPGEFQPVSIRMAKEQDLPLNPLKISGLCGRLMCCLRYEYDAYKDFKQRAPKCGTPVEMPDGAGKVVSLNVPRETVTIRQQGGPEMVVPLEALDCSAGRGCPCTLNADAIPVGRQPVSAAHATTPTLREAERTSEPPAAETRRPSRRKRRDSSPGAGEAKPPTDGGKGARQSQKQRQPRAKGGGQVQGGQQAPAQPASPDGTRRRRRRRPRPDAGGTTGA